MILLLGSGLLLAACGGSDSSDGDTVHAAILPDWVRDAPPRVREAYDYAIANLDEVAKYPCYCGCGPMGHTSNLSCYVKDIAPDGTITFDNHATGCGICVDITQDVKRLKARAFQPVMMLLTLSVFVLAILTGIAGTPAGSRNFGIIFIRIVWWALLIIVLVPFLGRFWCTICPIPAPGEWLQRRAIVQRRPGRLWTRGNRWPRRLKNMWLQNIGFLGVAVFST